jgi:hypothetical protein
LFHQDAAASATTGRKPSAIATPFTLPFIDLQCPV